MENCLKFGILIETNLPGKHCVILLFVLCKIHMLTLMSSSGAAASQTSRNATQDRPGTAHTTHATPGSIFWHQVLHHYALYDRPGLLKFYTFPSTKL